MVTPKGKVVRLTALDFPGRAEGKLQRPQIIPVQSPWQPFQFCKGNVYTLKNLPEIYELRYIYFIIHQN